MLGKECDKWSDVGLLTVMYVYSSQAAKPQEELTKSNHFRKAHSENVKYLEAFFNPLK